MSHVGMVAGVGGQILMGGSPNDRKREERSWTAWMGNYPFTEKGRSKRGSLKDVGQREVFPMGDHANPFTSTWPTLQSGMRSPEHHGVGGGADTLQPLRMLLGLWDRWNSKKVFKCLQKQAR